MAGPTLAIREQCPLATPTNDGLMSAADKAKIDVAFGAFQYTTLMGDDDDFVIPIPVSKQPSSSAYVASIVIQSGSLFTTFLTPYADQTTSTIHVLTDGILPVGTLLGVFIKEI